MRDNTLEPGYELRNDDETWAEVVSVNKVSSDLTAYNLTVAEFHTFYVAANDNAAPVWVHNCSTRLATNSGATGANNVNNAVALNRQLTAQEIAGGHGFEKHVLQQGEFGGLGITTRDQYAAHIENVLNNPSSVCYTADGRSYHLQESTGTVVV